MIYVKHNKPTEKTFADRTHFPVNILEFILCPLWEIRVGHLKWGQKCVTLIMPKQLVFQRVDGFSHEDDCFMFQPAVDNQTWQRKGKKHVQFPFFPVKGENLWMFYEVQNTWFVTEEKLCELLHSFMIRLAANIWKLYIMMSYCNTSLKRKSQTASCHKLPNHWKHKDKQKRRKVTCCRGVNHDDVSCACCANLLYYHSVRLMKNAKL